MKNVEVRNSKVKDKGVFALRSFYKGDLVLTIDDSHIVNDVSKLSKEDFENHCDYFDEKVVLMQPPEVYINHSCDPNVYVRTDNGERKVYAMKRINEGEEIAYDYSINGENDGSFECHCGKESCRGFYQGNFFKLPIDIQRKYLPYLDRWFVEKYREKIEKLKQL